jgi:hypothetical protein
MEDVSTFSVPSVLIIMLFTPAPADSSLIMIIFAGIAISALEMVIVLKDDVSVTWIISSPDEIMSTAVLVTVRPSPDAGATQCTPHL